jgi:integrase
MTAPRYPHGRPGYGEVKQKIISRADGTTYSKYEGCYKDATGKRRYVYDDRNKPCQDKLRQAQNEVEQGVHTVKANTVTMGVALDAWLADCERRHKTGNLSGNCFHAYSNRVKRHIRPRFGHIKLSKLTALECQDFIDELSLAYKGIASQVAIILGLVLKFARKRKWITRSPLTDEPLSVPTHEVRKDCPTEQDIRDLLETLATRQPNEHLQRHENSVAMITMAIFTGMRAGEIAGLLWENVDLIEGKIRVRHSLSRYDGLKAPKTKSGVRELAIHPILQEALRPIGERAGWPRTGYVFTTRTGAPMMPPKIYETYFVGPMRRAGLVDKNGKPKFRFHALRHFYQSVINASGALSLVDQAKLMGHTKETMTIRYTHSLDADGTSAKAAADAVAKAVRPIMRQICDNRAQGIEIIEDQN